MTIPNSKFIDQLHPAQIEVLTAFDTHKARFFDEEWHRKSRKTTLGLNLLIRECYRHPSTVYSYVGPTYKQARSIVWDDPNMLVLYLPDKKDFSWQKNEQKLQVKFENGSLLRILGADDIDSLRGPDNEGVVFDEWQLIIREAWTAVFLPMIMLKPNRWAMFFWTPGDSPHSVEEQAIRKTKPDWHVTTLKASQSKLRTPTQLEQAHSEMPQSLYDREYECAHVTQEQMTLITSMMLDDLRRFQTQTTAPSKRIISIDPGLGGDKCAIKYMENSEVKDTKDLYTNDSKVVLGECLIMSTKHKCDNFIGDSIGMGSTLLSDIADAGKDVQRFNSSESAVDNTRFANKKAEMWWYCMERVLAHTIPYPEDSELRRQIPVASQYLVVSSGGKIRMRLKADVKKVLGCSPDDADAWAMGIWGLQYIEPDTIKQNSHFDHKKKRSYMAA